MSPIQDTGIKKRIVRDQFKTHTKEGRRMSPIQDTGIKKRIVRDQFKTHT